MKKLVLLLTVTFLLQGCGVAFKYSTLNHVGHIPSDGIYDTNIKVDTISNVFQLKRKFRKSFTFRWNFAQYAMNQPLSWYYNNPRLDGIWRPYNRFDVYFNSNHFWTSWAYDYPWWGWDHPWWVRHNRYYNWYYPNPRGWYSWNHWSYDWYTTPLVTSNTNYVYVNGRRGSRNFVTNSNIEQDTNRRIRRYPNSNNSNQVIRELRNSGLNIRVIENPTDGTNVIKPRRGSSNFNLPDTNVRPPRPINNSNSIIRPNTNYNNSSRGSSNISRGSNSSGGSSRGVRGKNIE